MNLTGTRPSAETTTFDGDGSVRRRADLELLYDRLSHSGEAAGRMLPSARKTREHS
jgi:hypothetical protein